MPPKTAHCPYCSKPLPSQNAVRLHISSTLPCNKAWKKQFSQENTKLSQPLPLKTPVVNFPLSPLNRPNSPGDDKMETIADNFHLPGSTITPTESIAEDHTRPSLPANDHDVEEEVQGLCFSLPYPCSIANPIGFRKTRFEEQRDHDFMNGKQPWQLFSSQDECELVKWLINNVNQKATEKYLKLPIVS